MNSTTITTNPTLDAAALLSHRDAALGQLQFAREYTLSLLEGIPHDAWYVMPEGLPTNLAWQIGHLAVAEYGLMLFRQRGRAPGDLELMPGWFRKAYSRGTTPKPWDDQSPTPQELLATLDRIHAAVFAEAIHFTAEMLGKPTEMPYAVHPLQVGAMLFCPLHESIHSGQIGLLRRALGLASLR